MRISQHTYTTLNEAIMGIQRKATRKPVTIQQLLQSSTPKAFLEAYLYEQNRAFTDERDKVYGWFTKGIKPYMVALADFYDGNYYSGNIKRISSRIQEMAQVRGRGKWTQYSGTAWRGLNLSVDEYKRHFTPNGKTKTIGGRKWTGVTTQYGSQEGIESWTTSITTAEEFSLPAGKPEDGWIPVILETRIESEESFMSPAVSSRLSPSGESEVIRVGKHIKTTTGYALLPKR